MYFAELSRPAQVAIGVTMLVITTLLAAFTLLPVILIVVLVLAVGVLPPLVVGMAHKAHDTLLMDRLGTAVTRAGLEPLPQVAESRLVSDGNGGYITVVTPGTWWFEARQRIENQITYLRLHGRLIAEQQLVTDQGKPYLTDRRLSMEHRLMLSDQLVRLVQASAISASVRATDRAANETAKAIRLEIYETIGSAVTGTDIQALRAQPELDRFFAAVAECENGHLGIPALLPVFIGRDGVKRVGRSCQYCSSLWSEKI